MKKTIILIAATTLIMMGCNKDKESIEPQPVAVAPVTNPTGGNGNGNPPPPVASTRFYIGLSADNYSTTSIPVIPDVTVDNVALIYVGNNLTSGIAGTPYDVILEYDIPTTLNVDCHDTIDFAISFNTTDFDDNDKIFDIQIYYKADLEMIHTYFSTWAYDIWTPINPKVFEYNGIVAHCN